MGGNKRKRSNGHNVPKRVLIDVVGPKGNGLGMFDVTDEWEEKGEAGIIEGGWKIVSVEWDGETETKRYVVERR